MRAKFSYSPIKRPLIALVAVTVAFFAVALVSPAAFAASCGTDPSKNNYRPEAKVTPSNGQALEPSEGTLVMLNGNPSRGNTFAWTQLSGPTVSLTNANGDTATFTAPQVGVSGTQLVFQLVASCNGLDSAPALMTVNVQNVNSAPVVDAGPDDIAQEGDTVTLTGSATDAEGDALTYTWTQLEGPFVTLSGTGASRTFVAPIVPVGGATLKFRFTASDGTLSTSDEKLVNVIWQNDPPEPVVTCSPNRQPGTCACTAAEGASVTLDGSASVDPDDGIASYLWEQLTGPPQAQLIGTAQSTITFNAPRLMRGENATIGFRLTVKDHGGLSSTEKCTLTILDATKPVVTVPDAPTAEAQMAGGAQVSYAATATDDYDGPLTPMCAPASGSIFPLGPTTVLCEATDAAGNKASASFTVTVVDTTAPSFTAPAAMTVEATSADGAIVTYDSPATADLVSGAGTASCAPASGSQFALGPTAVVCEAVDGASNKSSKSFNVNVVDTTGPAISGMPADIAAEATSSSGAVVSWTAPTASDLVEGARPVTCSPASSSTFAIGTTAVTCSASDTRGNSSSRAFNVEVKDTTAPVLSLPANITREATGPAGAAVSYSATANDSVDGSVTVSCTPASGSTFGLTTTTVNCSAADSRGNTAQGSFTVTVQDTTPPSITTSGNVEVEATGPSGASASFTATAVDIVDGNVAVSCSPVSGSTFGLGNTTVTCTSSDSRSNTATATLTVTVKDTTPPAITAPSGIDAVEATGPSGAVVTYATSALDIVDGNVSVSCTKASGSTFAIGTTQVKCSATDAAGNKSEAAFDVTVQDKTPPALSLPAAMTIEATGPSGAVATFTATATDIVDGSVAVTCSPASGATFALGTTTVECSAKDSRNNSSTGTFTVKVQDTTPPVMTLPASINKEATGPSGAVVTFTATAHDIVAGNVPVTCSQASGSTFTLGTTTVNCSATDGHTNTATGSFAVTIVDTTPPTLSVPASIPMEATGPNGAVAIYTATASDLVDGSVAVICSHASGATFPLGTTTVNCSAKDTRNNTATGSFTVTVVDTTAPALTVPANITTLATGPAGATVNYATSATDIVDGNVTPSCSHASGATFVPGTTTVTCTAKDARGNTATRSFDVWVKYNWNGFFQPINNSALNSVKAGQAIPVKFTLGGNMGMDIFAAGYPRVVGASCSSAVDEITDAETITAGGSSLQYDAAAGQYIYVWKSEKSWTNLCLQLQVKLKDGTVHVANFGFTK